MVQNLVCIASLLLFLLPQVLIMMINNLRLRVVFPETRLVSKNGILRYATNMCLSGSFTVPIGGV